VLVSVFLEPMESRAVPICKVTVISNASRYIVFASLVALLARSWDPRPTPTVVRALLDMYVELMQPLKILWVVCPNREFIYNIKIKFYAMVVLCFNIILFSICLCIFNTWIGKAFHYL